MRKRRAQQECTAPGPAWNTRPHRARQFVIAVVLLCTVAPVRAHDEATRLSASEITRWATAPVKGASSRTLPIGGDGLRVVALKRTSNGEAEVHATDDDLFIVRQGHARITVGGEVDGNRQVSPNEWRGSTITGGSNYDLSPGDVLWIPAGMPHQMLLSQGGSVEYLVVKRSRPSPPAPK